MSDGKKELKLPLALFDSKIDGRVQKVLDLMLEADLETITNTMITLITAYRFKVGTEGNKLSSKKDKRCCTHLASALTAFVQALLQFKKFLEKKAEKIK